MLQHYFSSAVDVEVSKAKLKNNKQHNVMHIIMIQMNFQLISLDLMKTLVGNYINQSHFDSLIVLVYVGVD